MSDEQREQGRVDEPDGSAGGAYPPHPAVPGSAPHGPGSAYGPAPYGTQAHGAGYTGYNGAGYNAPGSSYPSWGAQPAGTVTAEHPGDPYPTATLPADRPRQRRGAAGVVTAALLAGLVGGGAGFGGAYALLEHERPAVSAPALGSVAASGNTAPASNGTVAGAAAAAAPSTVDIRVITSQGVAEGSGVILTADGAVLTNNHVVEGSTGTINITLTTAPSTRPPSSAPRRATTWPCCACRTSRGSPPRRSARARPCRSASRSSPSGRRRG